MSTQLDPKVIKNISEQVYKRFPEVMGTRPSVKKQAGVKNLTNSEKNEHGSFNFLVTYRGSIETGDGKKMVRWVRVVVNEQGKILKITTSR